MSRLGRAVEKAEREGLLTWTHRGDAAGRAALEELPVAAPDRYDPPPADSAGVQEADIWSLAQGVDASLSPLLVAAVDPHSSAAEQYRLLRTRLEGREHGRRSEILIVSSPGVGDGKTTTSSNLALTMAEESQHRVVLVEADLRRPRLAELFGVRTEPGLVDVLVGAATLDDALVAVPGRRLFLLSAGLPGSHPTGLLASPLMQRCLDTLRSRFDRIIVDTAPLALADTHVLTRLADRVLMVVRAGITPRQALERALDAVDGDKVVGVVVNGVEETAPPYGAPVALPRAAGA